MKNFPCPTFVIVIDAQSISFGDILKRLTRIPLPLNQRGLPRHPHLPHSSLWQNYPWKYPCSSCTMCHSSSLCIDCLLIFCKVHMKLLAYANFYTHIYGYHKKERYNTSNNFVYQLMLLYGVLRCLRCREGIASRYKNKLKYYIK